MNAVPQGWEPVVVLQGEQQREESSKQTRLEHVAFSLSVFATANSQLLKENGAKWCSADFLLHLQSEELRNWTWGEASASASLQDDTTKPVCLDKALHHKNQIQAVAGFLTIMPQIPIPHAFLSR